MNEAEYLLSWLWPTRKDRNCTSSVKGKIPPEMTEIFDNDDQCVIVLATTNLPTEVDGSFVRRFDCYVTNLLAGSCRSSGQVRVGMKLPWDLTQNTFDSIRRLCIDVVSNNVETKGRPGICCTHRW